MNKCETTKAKNFALASVTYPPILIPKDCKPLNFCFIVSTAVFLSIKVKGGDKC